MDDPQQLRQRREPPFGLVQPEEEIDNGGEHHEAGQQRRQPIQPRGKLRVLEANEERHDERRRGGQQIVDHDQPLPARQPRQSHHGFPVDGAKGFQ